MIDNRRILNSWKEIASYLHVHEQTAMKLAQENGLPHAKLGGSVFTTIAALEKWIVSAMLTKAQQNKSTDDKEE